jgi:hypothetical protein
MARIHLPLHGLMVHAPKARARRPLMQRVESLMAAWFQTNDENERWESGLELVRKPWVTDNGGFEE